MSGTKPLVVMQQAVIVNSSVKPGSQHMFGYPINHPNGRYNNKMIRTSPIVSIDGNNVETQNTAYVVVSWGHEDV